MTTKKTVGQKKQIENMKRVYKKRSSTPIPKKTYDIALTGGDDSFDFLSTKTQELADVVDPPIEKDTPTWLSYAEAQYYKEFMHLQERIWMTAHNMWRSEKYKRDLKEIYKEVRENFEK